MSLTVRTGSRRKLHVSDLSVCGSFSVSSSATLWAVYCSLVATSGTATLRDRWFAVDALRAPWSGSLQQRGLLSWSAFSSSSLGLCHGVVWVRLPTPRSDALTLCLSHVAPCAERFARCYMNDDSLSLFLARLRGGHPRMHLNSAIWSSSKDSCVSVTAPPTSTECCETFSERLSCGIPCDRACIRPRPSWTSGVTPRTHPTLFSSTFSLTVDLSAHLLEHLHPLLLVYWSVTRHCSDTLVLRPSGHSSDSCL